MFLNLSCYQVNIEYFMGSYIWAHGNFMGSYIWAHGNHKANMWGATLGITDKMEARSKSPLLIPQAQSRDEGVKPCNSDLFFLSSAELTEKNIKVLIVFERSMRRHKAFCSCAQRIIHKVNHWHLFKDI